jgi:hypothetical protein
MASLIQLRILNRFRQEIVKGVLGSMGMVSRIQLIISSHCLLVMA